MKQLVISVFFFKVESVLLNVGLSFLQAFSFTAKATDPMDDTRNGVYAQCLRLKQLRGAWCTPLVLGRCANVVSWHRRANAWRLPSLALAMYTT